MYKVDVRPHGVYGFAYFLFYGEVHIGHGFRPTEAAAKQDGAEDLNLCRLFGVGRDLFAA